MNNSVVEDLVFLKVVILCSNTMNGQFEDKELLQALGALRVIGTEWIDSQQKLKINSEFSLVNQRGVTLQAGQKV